LRADCVPSLLLLPLVAQINDEQSMYLPLEEEEEEEEEEEFTNLFVVV
jgi:hypothetical protein